MNCARFEQLLPLYASGDLDPAASRRTREHLRSCAACARLAEEYKGVPQLARLYEPPEFGEEFFDRMRQNVLHEIEAGAKRAGPARTLSSLFPRMALAFATLALLVVTSAVVLSLYGGGRRGDEALQASDPSRQPVAAVVTPTGTTGRSGAAPAPEEKGPAADAASPTPVRASAPSRTGRAELKRERRRAKAPAAEAAVTSTTSETAPTASAAATRAATEPSPAATLVASSAPRAAAPPSAAPEAMRIEMQTRDPNVRIIWLVYQQAAAN